MSRFILAFSCFFRLLFTGRLPARAAEYLPEDVRLGLLEAEKPEKPEKPEKAEKPEKPEKPAATSPAKPEKAATPEKAAKPEKPEKPAATPPAKAAKPEAAEPARPRPERKPADVAEHHRDGALALLGLLQREGRLVDFLRESLDDYEDSDIGAAVRDIHRGCTKVIAEHLKIEPVMPGEEDDAVTVPRGFDPGEIRLIGDVSGDPPFKGTLRHHGWRVLEARLPALSEGVDRHVLAPAEVEVS
jgi:hypothetical protein